jgi:prepilin-type N-terminal cleavage/methylation domain-containing protein
MWERTKEKRSQEGFTLIELLIVIIILAILAAIVVFAVGSTGSNAKVAACNSDAKTFETALESYKAEVGAYPAYGNGEAGQPAGSYGLLGDTADPAAADDTWVDVNNNTIGPFMRQLPSTSNYQIVTDGNGGVFVFPAGAAIPSAANIDGAAYTANNFDNTTVTPAVCVTNS